MNARIKFGLLGLVYGVLFWFWTIFGSGGGHYNFPLMLATPVGFLLWPILGSLSANVKPLGVRITFLVLMACDYLSLTSYLFNADQRSSDAYWYGIAVRNDQMYLLFPASAIVIYAAGQIFLWMRFLRTLRSPVSSATSTA